MNEDRPSGTVEGTSDEAATTAVADPPAEPPKQAAPKKESAEKKAAEKKQDAPAKKKAEKPAKPAKPSTPVRAVNLSTRGKLGESEEEYVARIVKATKLVPADLGDEAVRYVRKLVKVERGLRATPPPLNSLSKEMGAALTEKVKTTPLP